jgi:hypothetical protein
VRIEQVSSLCREGQPALAVAQVHGLDEPLIVKVLKGVVRDIEVMLWHDSKRTDGSKRPTVFAAKLVDSVTVNDQFARIAARQVKVAHQPVARIMAVAVAHVVHARSFVIAIPVAVFARIIPSSIGHGSPPVLQCGCFGGP